MELFLYFVKVSACTAIFYSFYHFVLSRLTFFNFNRWYLIGTLMLSFTIPLLSVNIEKEVDFPIQINLENSNKIAISNTQSDAIDPEFSEVSPSILDSVSLSDVLIFIYIAVFAFLLVRLLIGIGSILKKAKTYNKKESQNLIFVKPDCKFKNSSFHRYIFIDESLTDEVKKQVIYHEEIHVSEFHFIDKLFVGLSTCVLWFNPFVYAYLNAVEANHEFEVDAKSIKAFDKKTYASLILNLAQPSHHLFINHFSKLPLKKRMSMLFKNPTNRMKKLVYLSIVPLLAVCCLAFVKQNEVLIFKKSPLYKEQKNLKTNPSSREDSLIGKMIIGKIVELGSSNSLFHSSLIETKDSTIAVVLFRDAVNKLKIGDRISLKVSGILTEFKTFDSNNKLIAEQEGNAYLTEIIYNEKGEKLWSRDNNKYAFLHEANQVRFAKSKIEKIERNADKEIERIVLFDGEFRIELNFTELKLKSQDFKIGDHVTARFIGEKLTSEKYYSTNKMVAIHNQSNNSSLINKSLYPKFYLEDGKQIQKSAQINAKPILLDHQEFEINSYINAGQPSIINTRNFTTQLPNTKIEQTLVIDAGHGGQDDASKSQFTGKYEKDLNLRAALILKEEAEKRGIKVIMTREKDEFITLKERVRLQNGANAFVSIHHNSMPMNKKTKLPVSNEGFRGVEIYISNNAISQGKSSKMLGENVLISLKNLKGFPVRDSLIDKNVYVIREATVPSILVEFANISYKEGNDFISDEANVRRICNLILDGFEKTGC
jgi:N-acetylmuramoyl-L-alanine amidase